MSHDTEAPPRPGVGRPTREQAARRHEELLDHALEMFLEHGFELTTIDALAAAVGMTKRTVYSRYEDKRALFRAAVQRAIARSAVPIETMRASETDDLEETLTTIARIRADAMISPAGLRLQRIINAESYRFPEIAQMYFEQATRKSLHYLADLLRRRAARGDIVADEPELLATAFLSLAVGSLTRRAVLGDIADNADRERRARFYVRMFLNGVRRR